MGIFFRPKISFKKTFRKIPIHSWLHLKFKSYFVIFISLKENSVITCLLQLILDGNIFKLIQLTTFQTKCTNRVIGQSFNEIIKRLITRKILTDGKM